MEIIQKTAIVTGGTKGIGKAITEALINNGANVIAIYRSDEENAKALQSKYPNKLTVYQADLSDKSSIEALFEKIKETTPKIDILINNAGIFNVNDSFKNIPVFEEIFNTNFLSAVSVTSHTVPLMKQGKIIFISSVHGKIGHGRPTAIAYSAMKASLDSYMKNLAKELAPNILVNTVAPGKTLTPMWGTLTEEDKDALVKDTLLKRWITPEEVSDTVLFLLKNDAITGEIIYIDAGLSLVTLG